MKSLIALSALLQKELLELDKLVLGVAQDVNEDLLKLVMAHLSKAKGKLLRPILTMACGRIYSNERNQNSIFLAAAVEFIHIATILHDDVIDQSLVRRGESTVNAIWGNKASILVGDYIFSQSFNFMLKTGSLEALQTLAETSTQISKAEIWQLELMESVYSSLSQYIELITQKTAVLFAAACKTGAIAGGAIAQDVQSLYNYGLNFGIVFQIMDDYLDYFGSESELGKIKGNDFFEKKMTLPLILLIQYASCEEVGEIKQLLERPLQPGEGLSRIIDLMSVYDISCKIKLFVKTYIELGQEALASLPNNQITDHLRELLEDSMDRMR